MSAKSDLVHLRDVRIVSTKSTAFSLSFLVVNEEYDPVFVTYPLQEYDNVGKKGDLNKVYVFLEGSDLGVGLMLWPVPPNIDVYRPEVPLLTKVAKNSALRLTFSIPNTLKLNYPYQDQTQSGGTIETARSFGSIVLKVGYVPLSGIANKQAATNVSDGQQIDEQYGAIYRAQKILSRHVALPAPILVVPQQ
jgi:hypothetical protein